MSEPIDVSRRKRRASYLVLFTLLLIVLLLSAAYAVDLGVLHLVRQQLRQGVDASTVAASTYIDGTSEGMDAAKAAALATANANVVRGDPIQLTSSDIVWGSWDIDNQVFTATTEPEDVNALKVIKSIPDVSTPFSGAVLGVTMREVRVEAIGMRPPPEPIGEVDCFLPIAVPKCRIDGMSGSGQGVVQIQLSNDSNDTAGWAHPDGANAANIRDAMEAAATGRCEDRSNGPTVAEGDNLPITNGVDGSVLRDVGNLLRVSAQPWQTDLWGPKPAPDPDSRLTGAQYPTAGVLQGPVPVVNGGGDCSSVRFNQTMPITQLAWGVVFDVYSSGQHKGVQLMVDFEHEFESSGTGTGSGNVTARPPGRLVR